MISTFSHPLVGIARPDSLVLYHRNQRMLFPNDRRRSGPQGPRSQLAAFVGRSALQSPTIAEVSLSTTLIVRHGAIRDSLLVFSPSEARRGAEMAGHAPQRVGGSRDQFNEDGSGRVRAADVRSWVVGASLPEPYPGHL